MAVMSDAIDIVKDHPYESIGFVVAIVALYWIMGRSSGPATSSLTPAQQLASQRISANEATALARIQVSPALAASHGQQRVALAGIHAQSSATSQQSKMSLLLTKLGINASKWQTLQQAKPIAAYSPYWYRQLDYADQYALAQDTLQTQAALQEQMAQYAPPQYNYGYGNPTSSPYFWGSLPSTINSVGSFFNNAFSGGSTGIDFGGGGSGIDYGGGGDAVA